MEQTPILGSTNTCAFWLPDNDRTAADLTISMILLNQAMGLKQFSGAPPGLMHTIA
jgi:hypothetical protein